MPVLRCRLVHLLRTPVAIIVAALAFTMPVSAQAPVAVPEWRNVFSINPLGLPFEFFSAEAERKATGIATLGASASYFGLGDAAYLSLDAKLRLYPNAEAPEGFSIGLGAGISRVSEDFGTSDRSSTHPTISVITDYNWLLGKSKRVLVGIGLGAKRVFGDSDGFDDINFAYPTVRFQVGILF